MPQARARASVSRPGRAGRIGRPRRGRLGWAHVMAKDTALAKASDAAAGGSPPRQLWQVPVFLLGLLAVAGVPLARPYWHDTDARRLNRDFVTLRRALAGPAEPLTDLL